MDRDVLLVEDIVDTGRTLKAVKQMFRNKGAQGVQVLRVSECQCRAGSGTAGYSPGRIPPQIHWALQIPRNRFIDRYISRLARGQWYVVENAAGAVIYVPGLEQTHHNGNASPGKIVSLDLCCKFTAAFCDLVFRQQNFL